MLDAVKDVCGVHAQVQSSAELQLWARVEPVAGTWRYEGGRVRLDAFDKLSRAVRRDLEDEAGRLAGFHSD